MAEPRDPEEANAAAAPGGEPQEPGAQADPGTPPEGAEPERAEIAFDAGMVEHVRMLTSLIEGREVSREEVLEMLKRTLRQHSIARESEIDQAVRRLLEEPPQGRANGPGSRAFDVRSAVRGLPDKEITKILRQHHGQRFLKVRIASRVHVQTKRLRRGRPRKDDPVKEVRTRVFHLEVRRDKEALRGEARTDGVFPLVTNLKPRKTPKKEVLLIYKYQPYVEKRHALFKSELEVAPVYLKKPSRAAGMVHAVFLAMTLDALIERTLRRGMTRERTEALPILPEGRLTRTPTTARLLEMFSDVSWYEFERGGETVAFPIRLSPLQKQLLRLVDMDRSAYA